MKQIKRIDEYVSKLFADPTLDEAQMAIVLTAEGGDGINPMATNKDCTNGSTLACNKDTNSGCTNYVSYCDDSTNSGCDNSKEKPTLPPITIINDCPLGANCPLKP